MTKRDQKFKLLTSESAKHFATIPEVIEAYGQLDNITHARIVVNPGHHEIWRGVKGVDVSPQVEMLQAKVRECLDFKPSDLKFMVKTPTRELTYSTASEVVAACNELRPTCIISIFANPGNHLLWQGPASSHPTMDELLDHPKPKGPKMGSLTVSFNVPHPRGTEKPTTIDVDFQYDAETGWDELFMTECHIDDDGQKVVHFVFGGYQSVEKLVDRLGNDHNWSRAQVGGIKPTIEALWLLWTSRDRS